MYHNIRFENEFGFLAKYISSKDNIRQYLLNSDFSNFNSAIYFKKVARYFDWKISLNSERNQYNWYGIPNLPFNATTIDGIEEEQAYNYFELTGDVTFKDSYIDYSKLQLSYYTDLYKSTEALVALDTKIDLPLDFLRLNLNEVSINTKVELLTGEFKKSYHNRTPINYSLITLKIHPEHEFRYKNFSFRYGLKMFLSLDSENDISNFIIYPQFTVTKPIIINYLNVYGSYTGALHTNTYKKFSTENPYISPTLFITQTNEKWNYFAGINGKINNHINFNLKAGFKKEENKPLFVRNNSKSDGTTNYNIINNKLLDAYEYGNSFGIYYSDVQTTSLFAEIAYDLGRKIRLGATIQRDFYDLKESFNLPNLQSSFFGKYNSHKWYATTNIFYVSQRKDATYTGLYPSFFSGTETANSFVDISLNGGYHFNDKFSVFLKLDNILNTKYQRFINFDTQGFQAIGGITYKFDF